MDGDEKKRLEAAGWVFESAAEFLGLSADELLDRLIVVGAARDLAVKTLRELVTELPECEECGVVASGIIGGYPACDECRSGDGMDYEYAGPLRAAQALLQRAKGRR